jgi:SPP1 gp7 family putative phage head morphogenesis protein
LDVRLIKKALNRLGYYIPYAKVGITDIPDQAVFDALKKFQSDKGLRATGTAKPGDATITALNTETAKTPEGYYIWRTVGDNKVRDAHAALNGTVRSWGDTPEPGTEFNCRCWAEAIEEEKLGPHDCREKQTAFEKAVEELQELEQRKNEIENELKKLRDELNELDKKVANNWMMTGLANMLPGLAGYAIGNIVESEAGKTQQKFSHRKKLLKIRIQYLQDELKLVLFKIQKAVENILSKQKELEDCKNQVSE